MWNIRHLHRESYCESSCSDLRRNYPCQSAGYAHPVRNIAGQSGWWRKTFHYLTGREWTCCGWWLCLASSVHRICRDAPAFRLACPPFLFRRAIKMSGSWSRQLRSKQQVQWTYRMIPPQGSQPHCRASPTRTVSGSRWCYAGAYTPLSPAGRPPHSWFAAVPRHHPTMPLCCNGSAPR